MALHSGLDNNCNEIPVDLNAISEYLEDNDRLDCGHYEYLDLAVPTPGGYLICTDCHARIQAQSAVRTHVSRPPGPLMRLSSWLSRHREPQPVS